MRLIMTLIVFAMASVTVAGAILAVALSAPELGLIRLSTLGWVGGVGFIIAAPLSYVIAGAILTRTAPKS